MAIAPERLGIGIRRHFTTPGVHPYDEVEWEERDARITNYKDGSVAFEQLGVEVPATWSVNATNILAQKYFRGTLGTDERETSLKQVADRVVNTITAWGVKDGYFADTAEAEAFSAELKHLIVTQKAAFNSPVWFNIGVRGVPQQASACQPYDALVSTPGGQIPIGRLVEDNAVGQKVFDANGVTQIVAVKHNGRKQVLRLVTKSGQALDVTGDHLVWKALDEEVGEFVEAGTLEPGDHLAWHEVEFGNVDQIAILAGIESIESIGEMDVYDIQTESGEYLSGNIRVHNCFILSVDDSVQSILNWYVEEGTIFKGGSGSGVNLSKIRSSKEAMTGGGTASGPVSFMRGADASAGTIKSGGKTRRAAKMVVLNVDHPDIEEFIWCKAREERKAIALRDAGFDMGLDGDDIHSIQYQNANNSVRVTDEFMRAVTDDADWDLKAVTDGRTVATLKARKLFRDISQAAWECADPGVQYDTTINKWHTAPATGPITASNPCFPGDAKVHTDKGLVPFRELIDRVQTGESFGVYTHDATNVEEPAQRVEVTSPEAFMITGTNEIVKLRFDNGQELRCTANHRIFTTNRGYVQARELMPEDKVKILDLPTPAYAADYGIPVATDAESYRMKGDRKSVAIRLPEKWDEDFAHYLGWLVGDGCISGNVASTIYGSEEDREAILPRHERLVTWMNGDFAPKPSVQANGTVQLRQSRRKVTSFLNALGVTDKKASEKTIPWSIEQAPEPILSAFLTGLFDADGCVYNGATTRYVGLCSSSPELLRGTQQLLMTLGINSRIYNTRRAGDGGFEYQRKDGSHATYASRDLQDLRVSGESIAKFARIVGFSLPAKVAKLETLLAEHSFHKIRTTARLAARSEDGVELTYNLSEPRNHSYIVDGVVVRNCSEYVHLDDSACNLASMNLMKFLHDDDSFDVEGFKAGVEVVFTAQEILVGNADYPTEKIAETSRRFRQLGMGYANLGALLMAEGLPYDSDGGRAWAGAITALMTGHAYETSARIASRMGPFAGYSENEEHMQRVLRMHRDAASTIDEELVPPELLSAAQESWDKAVELAEVNGVRNSQSSVLAPTGTISLLMDCDTTGIEPDLSLVKTKTLVGGGTMSIVNQTVPRALDKLGYSRDEREAIIAYIAENKTIVGAPALKDEHLPVFACSMGDNVIEHMGHIRMMAAAQPFLSGAVSKTVNLPEDASVESIEEVYLESWKLGLKAVAVYRDNCKLGQPLSTTKKEPAAEPAAETLATTAAAIAAPPTVADELAGLQKSYESNVLVVREPIRERMSRRRRSSTFKFRVADCEGYVTVGEYDDGRPGEIFVRVAKQGSTLAGIMDAFAVSVSLGLQYGVPLATYVNQYCNTRFEPAGMTDDPDLRIASSLIDYIFRRLAVDYLERAQREELGILTSSERSQPTLPGVEEEATPSAPLIASEPVASSASAVQANTEPRTSDAPYCSQCGIQMVRAGSCHACPSCGTTSGCS